MELEWKEPPVAARGPRRKVREVLDELKRNPGKWARVDKAMKTSSGSTKWKKHGCEAVSRTTGTPGEWDVYACWPLPDGEPSEPAPAAPPAPPAPVEVKAPVPKTAQERAKLNTQKPVQQAAVEPVKEDGPKISKATAKARWPETTNLDPDDPQDQYLARQRAKLEEDRKARLARAERMERARSSVRP